MRQGPISSLDLDIHEVVDWSWAPTRLARAALESMYWWGELIIHHRINTRKVYDFSHNHLRDELLKREDPNLMEEAYQDWYVLRRIGSVGLLWGKSGDAWLGCTFTLGRGWALAPGTGDRHISTVLYEIR
jgi:uncharacterized protein YcaQ